MAAPPPTPPRTGKPPRRPPSPLVWWLTLGALVVWNLLVFWPRAEPAARVPYTRFLAAVRADDVTRVRIVGDEITAWLAKPLAWPEQTAGTEAKAVEGAQTYTKVVTTLPAVVGDPRLLELLEAHHVEVTAEHPAAPWLMDLLTGWGPLLLLLGFFWWTGQKAMGQQAGLFGFGRTRARRYKPEGPQVTFDDVAGADEAKAELQEEVDFLRHPQKYHDLGARIPRGVLLVGPPGTGKTLLARAVAGEAGVPFFSLSGSEFVEMFVGVGASRVRDLFAQAKAAAPAIVFIDELDAVGRRRGAGFGAVNDEREQTLNQLLVEMDGFDERHEVIVLAATNRPDVLDPALLRPGRFDRKVEVGLPDRKGREGILRIHTRRLRLASDVALDQLARATTGLSGADLANLCNEAALLAARAGRSEVTMADFSEAEDKALLGGRRRLVLPAAERRVIAYHESGHALVAWLTPAADPVQKVTIVPHGRALGVTAQQPGEDRYNYSLSYLLARLTVMLGGRTAEEIAVGDVTTGAENDLVEATRLARHMVTRWGMGALGLATFGHDGQQPFLGYDLAPGRDYSEATAARIDEEVRRLLDDRHEAARRLLTGARAALDRLVDALLREETVTLPELERLLGPRPAAPPTPGAPPESP